MQHRHNRESCQTHPIVAASNSSTQTTKVNHISNKSRLQLPTKVIGANTVPDLSAAIQLTRSVRLPDLSA